MSQAFVREDDDRWLGDISPTMNALIHFLTRENNDIRVYEKKTGTDEKGHSVHLMSNGLTYGKENASKWQIVSDLK